MGSYPNSITVADISGDGKLDLVTTNNQNTMSILLGNGDGTFQAQTQYDWGYGPVDTAIADFNGDGKTDLAVIDSATSEIGIFLGPINSLSTHSEYKVGLNPHRMSVLDVNGDSKLDILVPNYGDNDLSVLLGKGDGTFAAQVRYSTGYHPLSIATADFDKNGLIDVVVSTEAGIAILLGAGNGTFAAPLSFTGALTGAAYRADVGDLNRDGLPEVITANADKAYIGVFWGNTLCLGQ